MEASSKNSTTAPPKMRVFKKTSISGKISIYIEKRDFIHFAKSIDPIDGVIELDKSMLKSKKKAFVQVLAEFTYGAVEFESMGINFKQNLFLASYQVYPPLPTDHPHHYQTSHDAQQQQQSAVGNASGRDHLTPFQQKLLSKLGNKTAFPFCINLPRTSPASVSLLDLSQMDKPCGVEYELRGYLAKHSGATMSDSSANPKDNVRLTIRKLVYAPLCLFQKIPQNTVEQPVKGGGGGSSAPTITVSVSLDKEVFYHGEAIIIHVTIDNKSDKEIRKLAVEIKQTCEMLLFKRCKFETIVFECDAKDCCPIPPGCRNWCRTFSACPSMQHNRDNLCVGLDGQIKREETNLASSTIIEEIKTKMNFGIIVEYMVHVRVADVVCDVPFILSHAKPDNRSEPLLPPPLNPVINPDHIVPEFSANSNENLSGNEEPWRFKNADNRFLAASPIDEDKANLIDFDAQQPCVERCLNVKGGDLDRSNKASDA